MLARTRARSRWSEYRTLLVGALDAGYRIQTVEGWRADGPTDTGRALVLRHDVDQAPQAASRMAAIEAELGVVASWYFRWRTADPTVIGALREQGASVGLHYETLTRMAQEGTRASSDQATLDIARGILAAEIDAFARLFGPPDGLCPHGDSRVPGHSNVPVMRGYEIERFAHISDAREAMRHRPVAQWVTDRALGWAPGVDPHQLIDARVPSLLFVVHPNHWMSGAAAWADRALSAVLPSPAPGAPVRFVRSRSEQPPLPPGSDSPSTIGE